jgi:hypothetical protein
MWQWQTYVPFPLEAFEITKSSSDIFVGEIGLVLLQESAACFGVVCLDNGVFEKGLFESFERGDDAVDFG